MERRRRRKPKENNSTTLPPAAPTRKVIGFDFKKDHTQEEKLRQNHMVKNAIKTSIISP